MFHILIFVFAITLPICAYDSHVNILPDPGHPTFCGHQEEKFVCIYLKNDDFFRKIFECFLEFFYYDETSNVSYAHLCELGLI
jgi:hypothetical protein